MTTITLQDPSSKPGSYPTEVKTLSEARTLPEGGELIMSETMSESKNIVSEKDNNVFINTLYFIPYTLGGKLFVRKVEEVINNYREIHTIKFIDEGGMIGGIHETYCSDGEEVEHFEQNVLTAHTKNDDLAPPVQTELNGKQALIFRRLHENGNEHLYLAYYGDQTTITKLLKRYESGIKTRQAGVGVREAVRELPEETKKSILTRLFQVLKKN